MSESPKSKVISIKGLKIACGECSLHDLCLPVGISQSDMERLEQIIKRKRPIQKNDFLFHSGDSLNSLYAIRSGSVKTFSLTDDGQEQILGFHLPGELLGLDAIHDQVHHCSGRALETTSICEVPFEELEELASHIPGLQQQLFRLMSKELQSDESFMMVLGKKTSEERLSNFLLNLSMRFKQRGFSGSEFNLSMSRNDIANYLGLAVETVSRLFTRFQNAGLIEVNRKLITITDMDGLKALAGAKCKKDEQSVSN
jgi:CRP/FNR family transcriptional regulator